MRIGLATETREDQNNQDKAEHVTALSDYLVVGMKDCLNSAVCSCCLTEDGATIDSSHCLRH